MLAAERLVRDCDGEPSFAAAFATALLDPRSETPAVIIGPNEKAAVGRYNVYRNNVTVSLIDALAAVFPATQRLAGVEFFRAMAHVYAAAELPRSPIMLYYGETFPAFIDDFEPARPVPYLGDIARVEMARGRAYHAADATPLDPDAFAQLSPDRLGQTRVRLHPSLSIITSSHPIYSIWHMNQDPVRFTPDPNGDLRRSATNARSIRRDRAMWSLTRPD